MTIKDVAARTGLSHQAIYKRLKANGLSVSDLKDKASGQLTEEGERILAEMFSIQAEESAPEEPTEAEALELYVTEEAIAEWMDEIEKELNCKFAYELLENIIAGIIQDKPELLAKLNNIDRLSLIARQAYLIGFNRALHEVHGVQDFLLRESAERRAAL